MRWFKMMADNLDDPFIQDLICEFGAEGYLVFFGIISLICRENKKNTTGKAEFSARFLKQKLHISPTKVRLILDFCQTKGKLFFTFSAEKFNFYFPKILEIKDDYSRKSGHSPDKVHANTEIEVDIEVDKDTHPKKAVCVMVDFFRNEFEKIHGVKPPPDQAKKIYAGLVSHFSLDDLKRATQAFLECRDPPLFNAGYPIAWLPHRLPGLLAKTQKEGPVLPLKKVQIQAPSGNEAEVWAAALERIKGEILPDNFTALIEPIRAAYINGKSAVLVAPTRYIAAQVIKYYPGYLEEVLGKEIELITEEEVE